MPYGADHFKLANGTTVPRDALDRAAIVDLASGTKTKPTAPSFWSWAAREMDGNRFPT